MSAYDVLYRYNRNESSPSVTITSNVGNGFQLENTVLFTIDRKVLSTQSVSVHDCRPDPNLLRRKAISRNIHIQPPSSTMIVC